MKKLKSHGPRYWREKLAGGRAHEVKAAPKRFAGIQAGQLMLIPTPAIVDRYIRSVRPGRFIDSVGLRARLAKRYQAEVSCPLVTGICLRIVAEAAYEAMNDGVPLDKVTPFWRAIDEYSTTAGKLSFDSRFIKVQREHESPGFD